MRIAITFVVALSLFASDSFVLAAPKQSFTDNVFTLPPHAKQVTENVYSLGQRKDPQTGKIVDGYAIVHPKRNNAKPDGVGGGKPGGGGDGGGTTSTCYGFLANGAKWKSVEPWIVNPANNEGVNEGEVFSILEGAIAQWEDATNGVLNDGQSQTIFGAGSVGTDFATDDSLDGQNSVRFGLIEEGTIGVTTIWGIFGGNPRNRELVEWDQVYNTFYSWSTASTADDMDFESIATHEVGHSFGLADLYQSECANETMFGYGSEGDTKARTLNAGDIAGINSLY